MGISFLALLKLHCSPSCAPYAPPRLLPTPRASRETQQNLILQRRIPRRGSRPWGEKAREQSSNKDVYPFPDSLSADGADGEGRAALQAGPVPTLEDQFDLVVDTNGTCDPFFHLAVAILKVLHQLLLICGFQTRAALHFCAVCRGKRKG